jgi:hypothetical protein
VITTVSMVRARGVLLLDGAGEIVVLPRGPAAGWRVVLSITILPAGGRCVREAHPSRGKYPRAPSRP